MNNSDKESNTADYVGRLLLKNELHSSSIDSWLQAKHIKSLTIGSPHLTIKGCSDSCSSDIFLKKYVRFNYTCCAKNFCNLSSKAHLTNQILFLPVMIICFYLYAKK
ncbi:uncharacterized protein DC041_0003558 [Schistosoma bovis]|uniref:Uncharacterized protein n=1 Tax=Schistosoma bovis TaxID=6184 RepID=A0A430QN38_SCHBO|nr:uncharacterized protein DC041_0003558 [Schistosoma bovis]